MKSEELTPQERACLVEEGVRRSQPPTPVRAESVCRSTELPDEIREGLTSIWRDFGMRWSEVLTLRLRCETLVELAELRAASYGDFVFEMERPTCLQIIRAPQLTGPLCVELPPPTVFALLDRLLGGEVGATPTKPRGLTDIESRLIRRVSEQMLEQVVDAWMPIAQLSTSIERLAHNPRVVRAAHPGEPYAVAKMNITFENSRGEIQLGLPLAFLESHRDGLIEPQRLCPGPSAEGAAGNVEIGVVLAELTMAESELDSLCVGDILMTDTQADDPLKVLVNGRPGYWARVGSHAGKKAVQLEGRY